jgi:hypothetical protein
MNAPAAKTPKKTDPPTEQPIEPAKDYPFSCESVTHDEKLTGLMITQDLGGWKETILVQTLDGAREIIGMLVTAFGPDVLPPDPVK